MKYKAHKQTQWNIRENQSYLTSKQFKITMEQGKLALQSLSQ